MSNFREYLPLLFIQLPPPTLPYNPTQLPESCKEFHGPSTDFHAKYLFVLIFFIHFIDCITVKIIGVFLHGSLTKVKGLSSASFTCLDQLPSFWNRRTATSGPINQLPGRSASFPFTQILANYCYGVEPHKRKRPFTEPPDPQDTLALGSENRFYFLAILKSANNQIHNAHLSHMPCCLVELQLRSQMADKSAFCNKLHHEVAYIVDKGLNFQCLPQTLLNSYLILQKREEQLQLRRIEDSAKLCASFRDSFRSLTRNPLIKITVYLLVPEDQDRMLRRETKAKDHPKRRLKLATQNALLDIIN
ncbi:hypothetical protein T4D_7390 [Trichinella pseudospiralis]|uniref:Uncharacterized protein n=1 Tax=Trichinella pseudospiralis TaxID=6337 RepID=A0A0V1G562_TRIPS|nr:hypothetical protein T4D_7390 [Trichinella pseudospiralis]